MKANFKNPYSFITQKLLITALFFILYSALPEIVFSQPAKIWQSQFSVLETGTERQDWIYDMFTTEDCNNIVFCGYSTVFSNNGDTRFPAIGKVNSFTKEKEWIKTYIVKKTNGSDFVKPYSYLESIHEIKENGLTYYIATGSIKDLNDGPNDYYYSLIIKVDEDGNALNGFPLIISSPNGSPENRMNSSVPIIENGVCQGIIMVGRDNSHDFKNSNGIISRYDLDGNLVSSFTRSDISLYNQAAIHYDPLTGNADYIYAIGDLMIIPWTGLSNDNLFANHKVLVTKLDINCNKIKDESFHESDLESAGKYVDNSSGDFLHCLNNPQDAPSNTSNNNFDRGISILLDDSKVYLSCYFDYHNYAIACNPLSAIDAYLDADQAIIALNEDLDFNGGNDILWASYIDRYIGLDFQSEIKMVNGNIITGGSSTKFNPNLSLMPDEIDNVVNIVSSGGTVLSRKVLKDTKAADCPFVFTSNCNGDILVGGNNAVSLVAGQDEFESFMIIGVENPCPSLASYNINNDIVSNYTVMGTNTGGVETWSSNKKVKATIRIPNGKTLNINNATISFACSQHIIDFDILALNDPNTPVAKIIVEPGGTLNLNGATLKGLNECNRDWMWEGVELLGSVANVNSPGTPGRINMVGSTIEDAKMGIMADHGTYNANGNFNQTGTSGGGIITSSANSSFLNNRVGVHLGPNYTSLNGSTFTNTSFLCTGFLKDAIYTNADGSHKGTKQYTSMNGVSEVLFDNCTWSNTSTLSGSERGMGIVSFNARYKVKNTSSFSNLDKGIYATAVNPFATLSVTDQCSFSQCQFGIHLKGGAFHHIDNNTFSLTNTNLDIHNSEVTGIRNDGASNIIIENNTLTGANSTQYHAFYGIVDESGGDNASFIFKNKFSDFYRGNQIQAENTGLQIRCNKYYNNNVAWSISPEPGSAGTLSDQGECGIQLNQAGNEFHDDPCINGNFSHIYSTIGFQYNYRNGIQFEEPICKSDEVIKIPCLNNNQNLSSCNQRSLIDASNVAFYTNLASHLNDPFEKGLIKNDLVRYHLDQNNLSSALTIIAPETTDHWKRLSVFAELYDGTPSSATTKAATIIANNAANNSFNSLWPVLNNLKTNALTFNDLNSTQREILNGISSNRTQAGYTSQSILENVFDDNFTPVLETINLGGGNKFSNNPINTFSNISSGLILKPNPVNDYLEVILPIQEISADREVLVFNSNGQLVLKSLVDNGNSSVTLNTLHLNSGYYIILIKNQNGGLLTSSFIK